MPKDTSLAYTLCLADDQVLITQDYYDINYITRTRIEEWGLYININKTKYVNIGDEQRNLTLEN